MTNLKLTHFNQKALIDYSFPNETQIFGITSAGGAGHLQLLNGIEGKIAKEKIPFIKGDILKDTLPKWLSNYCVRDWNKAKAEGDIKAQERLVNGTILWIPRHKLADILFFIPIFLWVVLKLYRNKNITRIIDTQPIGTKAIIRATRLINFLFKRHIRITKVSTEIASKHACSFANPAKSLTTGDKKIFEMAGPCPFARKVKESEQEFIDRQEKWWKKNFGLSLLNGEVRYSTYPIRPAFEPFVKTNLRATINTLTIKINNEDERIDPTSTSSLHTITIDPQQIIGMISIGSQAAREATKNYMQSIINTISAHPPARPVTLFIAAGIHTPGEDTLYKQLKELIASQSLPPNLTIIPMGQQEDTQFAPLMHRADFGIFGSGGMTTMELSATATGKIFLHSEALRLEKKGKKVNREEGFALWEKGNALHLVKTKGAKIIVPDATFVDDMYAFLETNN